MVSKTNKEELVEKNTEVSKAIDPKTEITITLEELQTLIQAERLAGLTASITSKINSQLK